MCYYINTEHKNSMTEGLQRILTTNNGDLLSSGDQKGLFKPFAKTSYKCIIKRPFTYKKKKKVIET